MRAELTAVFYAVLENRVERVMPFKSNTPAQNNWVERLETTMAIVRKNPSWETLLSGVLKTSTPLHTYMRKTTARLFEGPCKITHLMCLFTFLIDACAQQISRDGFDDIDKVFEDVLTFLTTNHVDNCFEFRDYLNMH